MKPKLVRDGVPRLIRRDGREPVTRKATARELRSLLVEKLCEESAEYASAPTRAKREEELADLLEVIRALAKREKIAWKRIEARRAKKKRERGGFEKRFVLLGTRKN